MKKRIAGPKRQAGSKKKSVKKDLQADVHHHTASHHSSGHHSDHHEHGHERPERRARPRGDDIFTKIQDATEKVLRERKHEIKK